MYLIVTRPNLMFVVSLINRLITCPTQQHFAAAKKVKCTVDYGVFYRKGGISYLIGFTDYVRDMEDSKVFYAMCLY